MVCTKHVAIIAKVFKGRMNDPYSFSILDSHSVIKVSQIFWQEGLRCSVPNSVQKQPLVFYESHRDLPIERVYKDFFNEERVKRIMKRVINMLSSCHNRGIIYR